MSLIQHPILRDVNHNPVSFDPHRPTLFIDIDGVINSIPYERKWVGPEGPVSDFMLWDPKNWEWEKIENDPSLHYSITRELNVSLDKWVGRFGFDLDWSKQNDPEEKARWKALVISLADEMLEELRKVIEEYELQVVYLTFWRSEALRLLEPELKLGAIGYLDWHVGSSRGHAMKIDAIARLYEESEMRAPFIVIDDESLRGISESSELWWTSPRDDELKRARNVELNSIRRLYLEPDARWGIERKHIAWMRVFLDSLKESV